MTMSASHRVRANGIDVHYLREGSGPPLVLLHGWPEFCRTWRKVMPLLRDGFDLIAPDLRGFGDTEKPYAGPTDAMTAEVLAEDLAGLLDALGLARVGLVSHDVGAYAAQVFARRWPDRIAGLFFFNCPYPGIGRRWGEPEHLKEIWYQSFHQMPWAADLVGSSREACRIYIGHFLRHWAGGNPQAFDDDIEAWVDNFLKPGNLQGGFNWYVGANRSRLAVMRGEAPDLPPIQAPTRVLWGGRDPVLKAEWSDRLPEFFTDLEASVAPEAGHFVQMEQPELAAAEIRSFFGRIAPRFAS